MHRDYRKTRHDNKDKTDDISAGHVTGVFINGIGRWAGAGGGTEL
jgi:hypothetical protein